MAKRRRLQIVLHMLAGGLLVLLSILVGVILEKPLQLGAQQWVGVLAGMIIMAFGFLPVCAVSRVTTKLCLSSISLVLLLAAGEGCFRIAGVDFAAKQEQLWQEIPTYYQMPIARQGDAFFKRQGGEAWTGQLLNTELTRLGILPNPYTNEPAITLAYDSWGFRNPDDLSDWRIAVAGDSFTELGYLAYDQLFTSLLAENLGVPVLNLGTSYTGPLTQLSYLREYGISSGAVHTVIVFFEGNDLDDLSVEYDALMHWRKTGQRNNAIVSAYFTSAQGTVPVTLNYTPPGKAALTEETMNHLRYFFQQYADFGSGDPRVTPWLVYMPCKRRVLHDRVAFADGVREELRNWQPTDLAEVVAGLCEQFDINFIDLTSALVSETARKDQLLYNPIYDTHINSSGSQVVADVLTRHFSDLNSKRLNGQQGSNVKNIE
jgi:hypothetical protein